MMTAARRLAAILAADVVGYSRLMGEDEAGTALSVREHRESARPIVASHGGRIVKTTGDGLLLEFPSVVAAVECAIAIQKLMVRAKRGDARDQAHRLPHRRQSRRRSDRGRRYSGRRGQHRGAARRPLRAGRGADLGRGLRPCSRQDRCEFRRCRREDAQEYCAASAGLRGQRGVHAHRFRAQQPRPASPLDGRAPLRQYRRGCGARAFRRRRHREPDNRSFARSRLVRDRAQHRIHLQREGRRSETDRPRIERPLCPRGQRSARRKPHARQCPAHRRRNGFASLGRAVRQAARRSLRHAGRNRRAPGERAQRRAFRRRGATGRTDADP